MHAAIQVSCMDTIYSAALYATVIAHNRCVPQQMKPRLVMCIYAYPRTATQSMQNRSITQMSSSLM